MSVSHSFSFTKPAYTQEDSRLCALIPELRNQIYEIFFSTASNHDGTIDISADLPTKHLSVSCQMLYRESKESYKAAYRSFWDNTFLITLLDNQSRLSERVPHFNETPSRYITKFRLDFECRLPTGHKFHISIHCDKRKGIWWNHVALPRPSFLNEAPGALKGYLNSIYDYDHKLMGASAGVAIREVQLHHDRECLNKSSSLGTAAFKGLSDLGLYTRVNCQARPKVANGIS